eukprot:CAMPEP_0201513988 /NCGR_PEP_ID=MMETSP0161_2-20130828/5925_1 /ASSEMBLY_ACC=CAM_ASM_000251 /TAXON_ID=180227 /ORGANISM="Neoparamoeba aestuarina, Strain SoJaBio B1-5/56/2" /LENGTH=116 /DNA_ID=CAMNT_0047910397 /DNA_START=90 /DNA_END=437 /DNA_ORIENTATION=+
MLPRELIDLILYNNQIFGTLDLMQLPPKLKNLCAFRNQICGPIQLTHLPPHFEKLSLHNNKIQQKVVIYGNLPPNVKELYISSQENDALKGVRGISVHEELPKVLAERIFGFSKVY